MNSEDFEKHILFEKLEQFEQIISDEDVIKKIELEKLTFFQSVFDYVNQRIKLTIPNIVQEAEIKVIEKEVGAGVAQINAYLGNNNIGHLNNAVNNFNTVLTRVRNLPIAISKDDFDFSKKIASFETTALKKYKSLEKEREALAEEILNFKTDLEKKNKEIERLFKLLSDKEKQIESLNSSFKNDFISIKTKHNQSFENDIKLFRAEFDSDKTKFKNEIDNLKENIDQNTSDLISDLIRKLEEAKKIVNVISNVGVTGNYQIIANEHKSSANLWRIIAIVFMVVLSILLICTMYDLSSSDFDWKKSLLRIIAAAALSYPATYASKESNKHRKLENINRTAELELASVDAFIEMLDNNKKQAIKEKLVEKYFGNEKADTFKDEKNDEGLSIPGFEKIINAISNFGK